MTTRGDTKTVPVETTPAEPAVNQTHELRVRIPTDVHRQLLALKILRGVTLADSVAVALDRYFEARKDGPVTELGLPAKRP